MRRFIGGTRPQGTQEHLRYWFTTSPWGSNPTNVVVTVTNNATGADVTSAVTSETVTITGNRVDLPMIENLVAGVTYRVDVRFDSGGNTFSAYFFIQAEI